MLETPWFSRNSSRSASMSGIRKWNGKVGDREMRECVLGKEIYRGPVLVPAVDNDSEGRRR